MIRRIRDLLPKVRQQASISTFTQRESSVPIPGRHLQCSCNGRPENAVVVAMIVL